MKKMRLVLVLSLKKSDFKESLVMMMMLSVKENPFSRVDKSGNFSSLGAVIHLFLSIEAFIKRDQLIPNFRVLIGSAPILTN